MEVNFKILNDKAKVPTYGSEYAAGADLYSCEDAAIKPHETVLIHTGIAIELPLGLAGLVYARSGLAAKRDLAPANKVGVIDCDYRGEILVALHNHGENVQKIEEGERIAQMVITPYVTAEFIEADSLSPTVRDVGGFGSSGIK